MQKIGPLKWDKFLAVIKELQRESRQLQLESEPGTHFSDLLFRGQGDTDWALETTLERYLTREGIKGSGPISAHNYYMALDRAIPEINSLADKSFERIEPPIGLGGNIVSLPHLELASYARRHDFPSPLLDWSRSFYISSFFAATSGDPNKNPAIYIFQDWTGPAKVWEEGTPIIRSIGPYINTHQRHFRQQSEYTFCAAEGDNDILFYPHADAADTGGSAPNLRKIEIDCSSRREMLMDLAEMNINHFTIYGSEEGLMRSKAFDVFVRDGRW